MQTAHNHSDGLCQEKIAPSFQQSEHFHVPPIVNMNGCNSANAFDSSGENTSSLLHGHQYGNGITSCQGLEQSQSTHWMNPNTEELRANLNPKQTTPTMDYAAQNALMDETQKNLSQVKETLTQTSVRYHVSSLSLATLFNPETVQILNKCVESCQSYTKKMEATMYDDC